MGSHTKRTREEVIAAIEGSGGIKMTIARKLGVGRQALDSYIRRWASVRAVLAAAEERLLDVAESVVITNIKIAYNQQRERDKNGKPKNVIADDSTAKWYLAMKARRRGYAKTDRREHTGEDGEAIKVLHIGGINPDDDI